MKPHAKLFFLAMVLVLTGCTAPIKNVDHAPVVTTTTQKTLGSDQVRAAIIRAGASLGWKIKDEGPNILVGTLHLRRHTAVVEIPYSPTTYSIKYRSSINLSQHGDKIHKNYNGWIENLSKAINVQLLNP